MPGGETRNVETHSLGNCRIHEFAAPAGPPLMDRFSFRIRYDLSQTYGSAASRRFRERKDGGKATHPPLNARVPSRPQTNHILPLDHRASRSQRRCWTAMALRRLASEFGSRFGASLNGPFPKDLYKFIAVARASSTASAHPCHFALQRLRRTPAQCLW